MDLLLFQGCKMLKPTKLPFRVHLVALSCPPRAVFPSHDPGCKGAPAKADGEAC